MSEVNPLPNVQYISREDAAKAPPLSGYAQYMRKWRVMVAKTGGRTGAIEASAIDVSNLRVSFYVEKSMNETPNFSIVKIYNLAKPTISMIERGDVVIIEAGYENGNYGMIFTGQIVQPSLSLEEGVDRVLTLVCQDGDTFYNDSWVSTTLGSGANGQTVIDACCADIGMGFVSQTITGGGLPRGKVIFGYAADYISDVASGADAQMYVEDGQLYVVGPGDYGKGTAVELNPTTGLIGTPNQTDDGVSGQCLINPSIKLNTLIHIGSSLILAQQATMSDGGVSYSQVSADGVYRIVKLVYEGDTHGDPWYCNFEAITQSGAKPDGLTDGATNPWR